MKNILVTGGAGFIGSHTLVRLIESGYRPIVLDNLTNSCSKSLDAVTELTGITLPFYKGNSEDEDLLNLLFSEWPIDAVIHFASLKSNADSILHPDIYYKSNIGSIFALIKSMERFKINTIVFSSSATVYGSPKVMPVREDYPVGDVLSPYGLTKYLTELYLADYAKKHPSFKAIALRYFNPVGAHPSGLIGEDPKDKIPVSLIPYITKVMLGELPYLNIFGGDYDTRDGTGLRDYVHVMDVAEGHVAALRLIEHMQTSFEAINLGTGRGTTVLEILQAFEHVSGISIPYRIVERRPGDVSKSFADINKARELMSWEPKYDIVDCARDVWAWQKAHPNGYEKDR